MLQNTNFNIFLDYMLGQWTWPFATLFESMMSFDSNYFDVVTMFAVFEYIELERLVSVLSKAYRTLNPGEIYIMTTPAVWIDCLLKLMDKLRLGSYVDLLEHKGTLTDMETCYKVFKKFWIQLIYSKIDLVLKLRLR